MLNVWFGLDVLYTVDYFSDFWKKRESDMPDCAEMDKIHLQYKVHK
jgi:hypothetical protein